MSFVYPNMLRIIVGPFTCETPYTVGATSSALNAQALLLIPAVLKRCCCCGQSTGCLAVTYMGAGGANGARTLWPIFFCTGNETCKKEPIKQIMVLKDRIMEKSPHATVACTVCQKEPTPKEPLIICAMCNLVGYCSAACQTVDQENHAKSCKGYPRDF